MNVIKTDRGQVNISGHPNNCPFCHQTITPNYLYGHRGQEGIEATLICPNQECNKSFIGYFDANGSSVFYFNGKVTLGTLVSKNFNSVINSISENFVTIYNQSFSAEQQNLTEICGVGYRKALEFLIKDYIIANKPDEREKVEKKLLGPCIAEYVDNSKVKDVAKRAVWLGNDETHYIRKWEGKNLEDLKGLIALTIHWIEMEELTKTIVAEMPE